jgi:hypothetical protein
VGARRRRAKQAGPHHTRRPCITCLGDSPRHAGPLAPADAGAAGRGFPRRRFSRAGRARWIDAPSVYRGCCRCLTVVTAGKLPAKSTADKYSRGWRPCGRVCERWPRADMRACHCRLSSGTMLFITAMVSIRCGASTAEAAIRGRPLTGGEFGGGAERQSSTGRGAPRRRRLSLTRWPRGFHQVEAETDRPSARRPRPATHDDIASPGRVAGQRVGASRSCNPIHETGERAPHSMTLRRSYRSIRMFAVHENKRNSSRVNSGVKAAGVVRDCTSQHATVKGGGRPGHFRYEYSDTRSDATIRVATGAPQNSPRYRGPTCAAGR